MNINWATNIADKLGLTKPAQAAEPTGDQSVRDAALDAKKKSGWKGLSKLPSGYGRAVRRQRNRDLDSAAKKRRRTTLANKRAADAFYDHAGQLARIYFGEVSVRPEVRQRVIDRVEHQAHTSDEKFPEALAQIERSMRDNLAEADQRAALRTRAQQERFLQSKRGKHAVDTGNVRALDRRLLDIG